MYSLSKLHMVSKAVRTLKKVKMSSHVQSICSGKSQKKPSYSEVNVGKTLWYISYQNFTGFEAQQGVWNNADSGWGRDSGPPRPLTNTWSISILAKGMMTYYYIRFAVSFQRYNNVSFLHRNVGGDWQVYWWKLYVFSLIEMWVGGGPISVSWTWCLLLNDYKNLD